MNAATVLKDGGAGGTAIGSGLSGGSGTVIITGGIVTATASGVIDNYYGFCFGAGIGGGSGSDGGSVMAAIQSTPTNGTANGDAPAILAETAIPGASEGTQVVGLTVAGASYYGTNDLFTDGGGKLYLWLPDNAAVTQARTEATIFTSVSGVLTADAAAPTVSLVTPSGGGAAASGDIVITFSEEIRANIGTVSLDGGGAALTDGRWNAAKTVYTVPYSGLDSGTLYTVTISGFQDYSGNEMALDPSHSFATMPGTDASLSALTLSSGTLDPAFATGTSAYTASVEGSVSSITVTPTVNDAGATVKVNGTAVTSGAASDAIFLSVGANTVEIVVTAQDGTTTQTYTITVTRANVPAPSSYSVTLNQVTGGTATVSSLGATAGTPIILGVSSLEANYSFVRWDVSPSVPWTDGSAATRSAAFAMPEGNVTITPVYQYDEPDYISRTLIDSATGITVSGNIHKDAALAVRDIDFGNNAACDAIRERMNDDSYMTLFDGDISLSYGFTGSLAITIPVGNAYDGETVTILHCANGTLKTCTAMVRNGQVTFDVTGLSPFAVFADDALDDIPKTGDAGSGWIWWALLAVSGAGMITLVLTKKKVFQKR